VDVLKGHDRGVGVPPGPGRVASRAKNATKQPPCFTGCEKTHQTGLSREQLYRSFSEKGNPTLKTMLAVMKALSVAACKHNRSGSLSLLYSAHII
jgi:hypothetical protein